MPTRQRAVAPVAQLLAQTLEPWLEPLAFNLHESHSVHSRRTLIVLCESVRLPQYVELPHVRVEAPKAMLRLRLRLLTYPRPQFLHTDGGRCHLLRASPCSRFLDQPGPLARRDSLSRSPLLSKASVAPHYQRFFAPTDPAATLRPSAPLPTPTLLRGLSPRDREGFTSFNATLRCVLPSLPRRNPSRLSASVLPRPVLPSPVLEWLGFRK